MAVIKLMLWILIIILLVVSFPKSCGDNTPEVNKTVEASCIGLELPFTTKTASSKEIKWCSGFCSEKDIPKAKIESEEEKTTSSAPDFIGGFVKPLKKAVIPIILIFGIIMIIKWMGSMKKKGKMQSSNKILVEYSRPKS